MTKDFVAINLGNSNSYSPNTKFFCSLCNRNLSPLNNDKEEFVCTHCNISYFPKGEKVKRANKFSTPGPLTDAHGNITRGKEPLIAIVEDNSSTMIEPKKPVFPRSLESLKRLGVKITSFSSTVDNEGV